MTRHPYGPHRPEDAPTTVTIGTFHDWQGDERDVPIAEAVLAQRERVNTLAHERACEEER